MALQTKCFTALLALIGSVCGVNTAVFDQIRGSSESLVTHVTLLWFFSFMYQHVVFQTFLGGKLLTANSALILFFLCMCLLVSCQRRLLTEWFVTFSALERFVSRVNLLNVPLGLSCYQILYHTHHIDKASLRCVFVSDRSKDISSWSLSHRCCI